ncbi:MAG: hypothetical protein ACXWT0_17550 [Methylobacter sp.]
MYKAKKPMTFIIFVMVMLFSVSTFATEVDDSISSCLKAWGKHPFGINPVYKTLGTSVKIFGIGQNTMDSELTNSPSLVLVNPEVNIMGGTTIELLNPNGWYCFRSNINVMGSLSIRAHCKAHLASAKEGVTALGSNSGNKSVTIMGSTQIELVGCK